MSNLDKIIDNLNYNNFFNELDKNNVHYDRRGNWDKYIEYTVWTSGYRTSECYELEKFFMQHGFIAMSMDFDKHCGKTETVYRFKKGLT